MKPCQLISTSPSTFLRTSSHPPVIWKSQLELKHRRLISTYLFYLAKNEFSSTHRLEQSVELKHTRNKQYYSVHRMNTLVQLTRAAKQFINEKHKRLNHANKSTHACSTLLKTSSYPIPVIWNNQLNSNAQETNMSDQHRKLSSTYKINYY